MPLLPIELKWPRSLARPPLTPHFFWPEGFYLNGNNRSLAKLYPGDCKRGLNRAICAIFWRFWPFSTVFKGKPDIPYVPPSSISVWTLVFRSKWQPILTKFFLCKDMGMTSFVLKFGVKKRKIVDFF